MKPATKIFGGAISLCDEHAEAFAGVDFEPIPIVEPAECFTCKMLDDIYSSFASAFVAALRRQIGEDRFAGLVATSIEIDDAIAKALELLPDAAHVDREEREERTIGPNEFRCAMCREVFYKGRLDGEAAAEHEERFPTIPLEDCDLVCDDCFRKLSGDTGIGLTPTKEPR